MGTVSPRSLLFSRRVLLSRDKLRPSCVLLPEAPTGGVLVTGSDLLFFLPFLRKKILIQNFFLVYEYLLEVYLLTPIVVH